MTEIRCQFRQDLLPQKLPIGQPHHCPEYSNPPLEINTNYCISLVYINTCEKSGEQKSRVFTKWTYTLGQEDSKNGLYALIIILIIAVALFGYW